MVKNQGLPNLNNETFGVIMNIAHLEGKLSTYDYLKEQENTHKYDIARMNIDIRLTKITGNLEPKEYLERLITKGY